MHIEVQSIGLESSRFVILRKYDFNFRFNDRPLVLFGGHGESLRAASPA